MSIDYLQLLTMMIGVVGAVGGIPQFIRWLDKYPHLKIRDIRLFYNPNPQATTYYSYTENGVPHKINAANWISFHVENKIPRLRFVRRTQATGLVVAASMSDPKTGMRLYNFSKDDGNNILAPGEVTRVSQEIPDNMTLTEYRVYISAISKEGDSSRKDSKVKVVRAEPQP